MGFLSAISNSCSSLSDAESSSESPEAMRKKHGFADFSAEMKRMQNYDLEKEIPKEDLPHSEPSVSTRLPGKRK